MKSLYLLRSQPDVDTSKIGVVGVSWGGYMTTMVCGLAGDQVKAGMALYGCGFFDLGSQSLMDVFNPSQPKPRTCLGRLSPEERKLWLQCLDAGRRAPNMKATFFLAAASNDFFGWPRAAQATLDAIPSEKNHLFAPNANHKVPVPGGSTYDVNPKTNDATPNFVPTQFQPLPTPTGGKGNWIGMEIPYFDYYLKGIGQPFPKVTIEKTTDPQLVRFTVNAPFPLSKTEIYWAKEAPSDLKAADVLKRIWTPIPANKTIGNVYEAKLPQEAAEWFALVSDNRPVTVSSDMKHIANASSPSLSSTPSAR